MSQLYSVGDRVVFSAIGCRAWGTQVLPLYNDIRSQNFMGLCEGVVCGLIDYGQGPTATQGDAPLTAAAISIATTTTAGVPVVTEYMTQYTTGQYRNRIVRMLGMVENEDARRLLAYYAIPRVVAKSAYISMLRDLGRAIRGEDTVSLPLVDVEEIVAAATALSIPVLRAPEKRGFSVLLVEEPDLNAAFSDVRPAAPVPADPMQRIIEEVDAATLQMYNRLDTRASANIAGGEVQVSPVGRNTGATFDWSNPVHSGSSATFAQESPEPPQAAYPVDPEPEDDDYDDSGDNYDNDSDEEAA